MIPTSKWIIFLDINKKIKLKLTLVFFTVTQSTKSSHELNKFGFLHVLIHKHMRVFDKDQLQTILHFEIIRMALEQACY